MGTTEPNVRTYYNNDFKGIFSPPWSYSIHQQLKRFIKINYANYGNVDELVDDINKEMKLDQR